MKNYFKDFVVVFIFVLFVISLIILNANPPDKGDVGGYSNIQYVEIAGQNIKVKLASTPEEQAQGLSGQAGLKEDEGMLFMFDRPGKYHFWMKDMNFAIDIIWISEDQKVIYIKKDARPEAYPEMYGPGASDPVAFYVLEVVAGFSEKNSLQVGDRVEFVY